MTIQASAYGATHVGLKREQNEDAMLIDEPLGVYVVCDGMGGHAAGEVASTTAARVVRDSLAQNLAVLADLGDGASPERCAAAERAVERAVQAASAEVYQMARADRRWRGMGCTLDVVMLAGNHIVLGHVGDSRVYQLRAGKCHRLTEDHTLINAQVKAGVLTAEEAKQSAMRNVLLHAVGIQSSTPVDTLVLECAPGDLFLLCSDGLHNYVPDDEMATLLARAEPAELPRMLVDLANARGGADNITVVVVSCERVDSETSGADAAAMTELLQRIPLFAGLTYKEQASVLAVASAHRASAGQTVVRQGDRAEDLYVVVRGTLAVERDGVAVNEIGPGALFGEIGIIDEAPRSATVRALGSTRLIRIGRAELMGLMRRDPRLAVKLLWSLSLALSTRLRAATDEIVEARQERSATKGDAPYVVIED